MAGAKGKVQFRRHPRSPAEEKVFPSDHFSLSENRSQQTFSSFKTASKPSCFPRCLASVICVRGNLRPMCDCYNESTQTSSILDFPVLASKNAFAAVGSSSMKMSVVSVLNAPEMPASALQHSACACKGHSDGLGATHTRFEWESH